MQTKKTPATIVPTNSNGATWQKLLDQILDKGLPVAPRGQATLELLGHQTKWCMGRPIIHVPGRKLSYKFMFAEAAWIMLGSDKVSEIAPYNKKIQDYSDDGETFFGAYGPKVVSQMEYVFNTLLNDRDSRQAVINIWRESPAPTKDFPCTLSLQWLIRDGWLHCFDTMRSNDAWWGTPYDVFNMSAISYALALALNSIEDFTKVGDNASQDVGLGKLYLTAASAHLYEPYFTEADALTKVKPLPSPNWVELFESFDTSPWRESIKHSASPMGMALELVGRHLGVLADMYRFKMPQALKDLK